MRSGLGFRGGAGARSRGRGGLRTHMGEAGTSVERDAVHPCRGRPAHMSASQRGSWRVWLRFHRVPFALTARQAPNGNGGCVSRGSRTGWWWWCQLPNSCLFFSFFFRPQPCTSRVKKRLALSPRVSTTVLWSFPTTSAASPARFFDVFNCPYTPYFIFHSST